MCGRLQDLRDAMVAFAGEFDPEGLLPSQATRVVQLCAQLEASVSSVKLRAAARSAEGQGWKQGGYRSPAEQLAKDAGMSPSTARRALETGRRLADQPEVVAAASQGRLSAQQAEVVADGVAADPGKASALIAKAGSASLSELHDEVAAIKAAVTDQEERRRQRHAKRSLRRWTDRDGAFHAHLYGHPEDGARLWRALDPVRRRLNLLHRQEGRSTEPLEALDYDALVALASAAAGEEGEMAARALRDLGLFPQWDDPAGATPSGPDGPPSTFEDASAASPLGPERGGAEGCTARLPLPVAPDEPTGPPSTTATGPPGSPGPGARTGPSSTTGPGSPGAPSGSRTAPAGGGGPRRRKKLAGSPIKIMVRVDLDALLRGVPRHGELCEVAGFGPVPVSVIEDLAANGNAVLVGLLTRGTQVIGVYHHRRRASAAQKSALDFLYPTCAAAGCGSRAGLQYDHRIDWAATHVTAFDLLDRLCPHHHALKTRENWALVPGRGKRAFVPPADPRHPGVKIEADGPP